MIRGQGDIVAGWRNQTSSAWRQTTIPLRTRKDETQPGYIISLKLKFFFYFELASDLHPRRIRICRWAGSCRCRKEFSHDSDILRSKPNTRGKSTVPRSMVGLCLRFYLVNIRPDPMTIHRSAVRKCSSDMPNPRLKLRSDQIPRPI